MASNPISLLEEKSIRISECLYAHAQACDAGYIDLARLVKVLFTPFLKLAQASNQAVQQASRDQTQNVPQNQREVQEQLLSLFFFQVDQALDGRLITAVEDGKQRWVPLLSASNRAQLVKRLIKDNIFKVLIYMFLAVFV